MRNVSSGFRLISDKDMDRSLYEPVKKEGVDLYNSTAAIVCVPGTPKNRMDEQVREAWGGPPLWRVRACRLGEAGPFSAAAIRQVQDAYTRFMDRHQARMAAAAEIEKARQTTSDRAAIRRYLAHHRAEAAKLEARLAHLQEVDPD